MPFLDFPLFSESDHERSMDDSKSRSQSRSRSRTDLSTVIEDGEEDSEGNSAFKKFVQILINVCTANILIVNIKIFYRVSFIIIIWS